jgi:hypothetical protein
MCDVASKLKLISPGFCKRLQNIAKKTDSLMLFAVGVEPLILVPSSWLAKQGWIALLPAFQLNPGASESPAGPYPSMVAAPLLIWVRERRT